MATPNTGIPYVPENTQDPAAGLNLALNVIDALLQTAVIDMDQTAPPGGPADGDLHIVASPATGAWVGEEDNLARYVDEGDFWQFYEAGTNVHLILNKDDGALYAWDGLAWVAPIVGGSVAAASVSYDNATSGLTATDVQAALDEISAAIGGGGSIIGGAGIDVDVDSSGDTVISLAGGSVAWGSITGTLSAQTDLQAALDLKAPLSVTQNSQSVAYTLVIGDAGKHIYHPSADTTARIWTIPANGSVAFPVGTVVTFVNDTSAGVITIAITTDTMVLAGAGTTGSRTLAANGIATAIKVTSTRWQINGTGLT